jgi:molecular chaperone HscB
MCIRDSIRANDNTAMPADFLIQQIQWREALDEAASAAALEALLLETEDWRERLLAQLAQELDVMGNAQQAAASVRSLMFVDRFAQEVDSRIDQICA